MSIKQTAGNIIKQVKAGRLKEMARQLKWVYGYTKKYWWQMILYTGIGYVTVAFSLLSSFVGRDLTNMIIGHDTNGIVQTFAMLIGYQLGQTIISQVVGLISAKINLSVDADIKADIFSKILVTDWESLTNYHTGDLLTRWGSDASNVSASVLSFIPTLIINVGKFISAFAIVIYNDPTFLIFAFAGIPMSLILSRTLMRRMVRNNERSAAMSAKMSGFNQETFSNIQTIKAFSLTGLYIRNLQGLQQDYIKMKLEFQKMNIWTNILLSTSGMIVTYGTYAWGIYRMWSQGLDYGTMSLFLSLSSTLTTTFNALTATIPSAISLCTSAGRLMDILDMPREDYSKEEELKEFAKKHASEGVSIEVNEMDYAYKRGAGLVFEQASLYAKPHEVVALVGPSGQGKTTMLRLILSLLNPMEGELKLYAGSEATDDPEKCYPLSPSSRILFSYVPQGNTMFSGTIAGNMRNVKEDATDEEIIGALKMACAWEFVEKLPGQIEYTLGERGGGLSEGQAQRLSIARALLRKSPILLLDEATSALDPVTEAEVLNNIMTDEYPRTCLVTTHRPSVLSSCTRVYEINEKKCAVLGEDEVQELMNPPKRRIS